MDLKRYNKAELKKELDSNFFWENDVMPITKHRALSFINNPRANKDDILLIINDFLISASVSISIFNDSAVIR